MTDLNLSSLSLDELKKLEKDVAKAITSYETRRRKEARAAAEEAAKELGFSLSDFVGDKKIKSTSVPKYRHPENDALTWTGKGRRPNWVIEAQNSGKTLDDLLIA